MRAPIPDDALRPTVRILLQCDGAENGMMITAHTGYERPNGLWSCNHLIAKNLLPPTGWTTPQIELHALSALSNLATFIQESVGEWVEVIYSASDSTIAISWSIYEKAKLMVFQRLRVANIRQKLNLENLFHIDGKHNLADFGTRPDLVTADLLRPESEWIKGKKWMTMSIEDARKNGILKNTKDIILDNDLKKELRKGAIFDDFEQADHVVNHIDVKKGR